MGSVQFLTQTHLIHQVTCNTMYIMLHIHVDHTKLFIKKSKTDIYRKGEEVLISQGETSACPLRMLQRYISSAHLQLGGDIVLFRLACRSGEKCFLLHKDKRLSYTCTRECVVSKLKFVAPDSNLGLHSLPRMRGKGGCQCGIGFLRVV